MDNLNCAESDFYYPYPKFLMKTVFNFPVEHNMQDRANQM